MIQPDKEYIIKLRREFHKIPEIGFDLTKTLSVVKRELDSMDIPYTEKYGKSSLVATLFGKDNSKTIALRADMDALPITEETNLPFASIHQGAMHACGHDCHIAMLLGTAKMLKESNDDIPCQVKLIFQAAEEFPPGGAKLMCQDGVMDDIDVIIGAHINAGLDVGKIALNRGCVNASSHGFFLDVYGKSCHVASPQCGTDAIALACKIYSEIQFMKARELNPLKPSVIGIGEIHGGNANNVICDHVHMHGTIRATDKESDAFIYRRITEIAENAVRGTKGKVVLKTTKHYPVLINNTYIADEILSCAREVLGEQNVYDDKPTTMGGEDFSFYLEKKPGAYFSVGVGIDNKPPYPLHSSKFIVNEDGLTSAPKVFFEFVKKYGKKLTESKSNN